MPSTLAPPDTYTYPIPPAIPTPHLCYYAPSTAPPICGYTDYPSPRPRAPYLPCILYLPSPTILPTSRAIYTLLTTQPDIPAPHPYCYAPSTAPPICGYTDYPSPRPRAPYLSCIPCPPSPTILPTSRAIYPLPTTQRP